MLKTKQLKSAYIEPTSVLLWMKLEEVTEVLCLHLTPTGSMSTQNFNMIMLC